MSEVPWDRATGKRPKIIIYLLTNNFLFIFQFDCHSPNAAFADIYLYNLRISVWVISVDEWNAHISPFSGLQEKLLHNAWFLQFYTLLIPVSIHFGATMRTIPYNFIECVQSGVVFPNFGSDFHNKSFIFWKTKPHGKLQYKITCSISRWFQFARFHS